MDCSHAHLCQPWDLMDQKILCIGDNSSAEAWAHHLTEELAKKNNSLLRGQIDDEEYSNIQNGYYHTGIFLLNESKILKLSKKFDKVIILDQPIEKFSHPHLFTSTWKLIKYLEMNDAKIEIVNKTNMAFLDYWDELLKNNKSFCLYPWVKNVVYNKHYTLCTQSTTPVTKETEMHDWKNDKNFLKIRKKMLAGELVKPHCNGCYRQEELGKNISIRVHETIEWAALCNLKNLEDLNEIESASYYEVRFSNKCNIKCRTCNGHFSHLIDKESKKIEDPVFQSLLDPKKFDSMGGREIIDYKNLKRVYFGGGEPTVMPQLYNFLRECIETKHTDFEIRIGTNAVKISDKLFDLLKNFTKLTCSISMDGTPRIDEYIRWGTKAKIKNYNIKKLNAQGNGVSINFVCSIYNVFALGEILEYFESEFPYAPVHFNVGGYKGDIISPFIFPDPDLVLRSVAKAKKTKIYFDNEQRTRQIIDGLERHYSSFQFEHEKLSKFFYYNDTLDRVRGSKLQDYLPELAKCRSYVKPYKMPLGETINTA